MDAVIHARFIDDKTRIQFLDQSYGLNHAEKLSSCIIIIKYNKRSIIYIKSINNL